jgi:hypothetical protein
MRKRLRYADLHERRIVNNRATLSNWIRDLGFPPGQLTGPNSRTWMRARCRLGLIAGQPLRNRHRHAR